MAKAWGSRPRIALLLPSVVTAMPRLTKAKPIQRMLGKQSGIKPTKGQWQSCLEGTN